MNSANVETLRQALDEEKSAHEQTRQELKLTEAGTIQFIVQFQKQQKLGERARFIRESKLEHGH